MDNGSAMISGDKCACSTPQEIQKTFAGRTVFVDAIQADQVTKIDTLVRSCLELGRSAPRFVLVGRDAKTEQKLSGALTGIITDVELPPVQILEHLSDSKPLLSAQSPFNEASPQAQSPNIPEWNKQVLWLRGGLPDSLDVLIVSWLLILMIFSTVIALISAVGMTSIGKTTAKRLTYLNYFKN